MMNDDCVIEFEVEYVGFLNSDVSKFPLWMNSQ